MGPRVDPWLANSFPGSDSEGEIPCCADGWFTALDRRHSWAYNIMHKNILRHGVRVSILSGFIDTIYTSLAGPGCAFYTKFAVLLGFSPMQFSLMAALIQFAQLFQLLGIALTSRLTSRKGVVLTMAYLSRILAFGIGLLPFVLPTSGAVFAFFVLIFITASLQAIGANAWTGWIADLVPISIRGRFLSVRAQWALVAGAVTGFLFGGWIDLFDPASISWVRSIRPYLQEMPFFSSANWPWAFLILFGIGTIVGIVATRILQGQPEHPKEPETMEFSRQLLQPFSDPNFRRLLVYGSWWMLAIGIGAPFWGPYMLKNLGMSMVELQIYGIVTSVTSFLALRFWGRFVDRFGNKSAMRICILMGGLNPLVWLFVHPGNIWILYLEAASCGVMWSGANLVGFNLVLAIAPTDRRQAYTGVFGAFSGLGLMVTMLLSVLWMPNPLRMMGLELAPEQVLFGLTGLLRWTAQIPLVWVSEPRSVPMREVIQHILRFGQTTLRKWLPF